MLALFTDPPSYCPQCGTKQSWASAYAAADYRNGVSFDCRAQCGVSYAHLSEDALLTAATQNGSDLERMLRLSR